MDENEKSIWFDRLAENRRRLAAYLKTPAAAGLWRGVVDKYSDKAHFVYELLQNSDDAHATEVNVRFFADMLEYQHNGTIHFSVSDPEKESETEKSEWGHINSLTSVGSSNKVGGEHIGTFGLGFKSVFQYTAKPHVEDDCFSFDIEDFIVPVRTERRCANRQRGNTAFLFPIVQQEENIPLIFNRFISLDNPLLFLSFVKEIRIQKDNQETFYKKETLRSCQENGAEAQFVKFSSSFKNDEFFYVFSFDGGMVAKRRISCAFRALASGSIDPQWDCQPLYAFFPTLVSSPFHFALNAPFMLTDNRENLKDCAENEEIAYALGQCVVRAVKLLTGIRNDNGEDIVNEKLFLILSDVALPLRQPFFQNILKGFCENFSSEKIFPVGSGCFIAADSLLLAEDGELMDLFSPVELSGFLPNCRGRMWGLPRFYELQTSERSKLLSFLQLCSSAMCLTASDVIENCGIASSHIGEEHWFSEFYGYLNRKGKQLGDDFKRKLKCAPVCLCKDGVCRAAFVDGKRNVYLTGGVDGKYCCVHPSLLGDAASLAFFKFIGLAEPGRMAEISASILPLYRCCSVRITDEDMIARHLNFIFDYYNALPAFSDERALLLKQLSDVEILPTRSCSGRKALSKIHEAYFRSPELEAFLATTGDALFFGNDEVERMVAPEKRRDFYAFLSAAGLHFGLNIKTVERTPSAFIQRSLDLHPASLRQSDNGAQQILDRELDGGSGAWTVERSVAFFRLLRKEVERQTAFVFRTALEGVYRYVEKGKRHYTETSIYWTTAKQLIYKTHWIYGKDQQWHTAEDLHESSQLADMYDKESADVLLFLGIRPSEQEQKPTDEQWQAVRLVEKYRAQGLSLSDLQQAVEQWLKKSTT